MQHGCNKIAAKVERERQRRQEAIERFEQAVHRARVSAKRYRVLAPDRDPEHTVTLPLADAELVLACAHHRHERRGRWQELAKAAVVLWALRRKDHLRRALAASDLDQGKRPTGIGRRAATQAAKEAEDFASERYGFRPAASTIRRWMETSPKLLAGSTDDVN